jgi:hypothetical protein
MNNLNVIPLSQLCQLVRVRVLVFNVTFNNISVISWQSVSLMEEIGEPGEPIGAMIQMNSVDHKLW